MIARLASRQLVSSALAGESLPRVPVGPLAVHFCARMEGRSLREYTTSARIMAESVIRYYERFRPDAVWLSADTWVSAQAMGCRVGTQDDHQPFGGLGPPLIRSVADIDRIPIPDVGGQGRYPLMIEALERVVQALGKEVFIVACFDQYPFSLAAALMGLNESLLKLVDDPAFVLALMERTSEYTVAYGRAMADAGADMLSGGDSPAGLLGPELYRQFALPFERRTIANLQKATGKPISLHICGNTNALLPSIVEAGADVVELDWQTDLVEACLVLGPRTAIWGNLDPVRLLAQSTPAEVTLAARETIASVSGVGHRRFVLSSGCTLAVETPFENIDALVEASAQPWPG